MAPSKWRKVVQAVKEHTGKGLAKMFRNTTAATSSVSDLEAAIAKATRYESAERSPPGEKYVQEILALTGSSRRHISACVYFLAKRLNKTGNWGVVLKTLVLVHRLLREGDRGFEQEIFFANETHKMLAGLAGLMKHTSSKRRQAADLAVFLDFAVDFVRYLDQRLEHGLRCRRDRDRQRQLQGEEDHRRIRIRASLEDDSTPSPSPSPSPSPVRDLKLALIYVRIERLLTLLARFISCKPTGTYVLLYQPSFFLPSQRSRSDVTNAGRARSCGLVAAALGPLVVESHRIYYDIKEILNVMVERFMKLDTNECWIIHGLFKRISKQLEELADFYTWCKAVEIAGSTHEFPVIEKISRKKLDVMLRFIRDRSALAKAAAARRKKRKSSEAIGEEEEEEDKIGEAYDHLPPLIDFFDLERKTEGELAMVNELKWEAFDDKPLLVQPNQQPPAGNPKTEDYPDFKNRTSH